MIERFLFSWKRGATHTREWMGERKRGVAYVLYLVFVINNQNFKCHTNSTERQRILSRASIKSLESKIQNDKQYAENDYYYSPNEMKNSRRWKIKPTKWLILSTHNLMRTSYNNVWNLADAMSNMWLCMFIIPHLRAHRRRIVRQKENINIYKNYTRKKERIFSRILIGINW